MRRKAIIVAEGNNVLYDAAITRGSIVTNTLVQLIIYARAFWKYNTVISYITNAYLNNITPELILTKLGK